MYLWIAALALFNVALHLAFYNTLGFHRDELLYFSLGAHPSAGYASVPPLTGWLAWLMIRVAGSNLFSARLLPALFSGVMVFLASGLTKELKGNRYAQILAAVAIVIFPINLRGFYLFEPVFLDVFFWTLIFWVLLKWINTQQNRWLLFLGIAVGLGLMNKYTVFLQLFCLFLVIFFTPYRSLFRRRAFWLATVIAFLIFLPNIVWQVANGFPVITHMQALHDSQLVNVNRINFLTDQLMIGFMATFLILPGLFVPLFSRSYKQARFMAVASLLGMLILLVLRGKSYYTAGVLPFLICSGAVVWEKLLKPPALRLAFPLLLAFLSLPAFPLGIPVCNAQKLAGYFAGMKRTIGFDAVLRDEDGRYHALPQDYADMLGWDELANGASVAWKQIPDQKAAFIFCENYGEAGAITVLGKNLGLPQPVSFSESFYYWAPREFRSAITSVVYINDEMGEDVDTLFRNIRVVGGITNPLAREFGTKVWLCTDPKYDFNAFWKERVKEIESPF